jgi:hypothetical protein
MDVDDKPTPRRIASATIIGTLGSGLVVATVVRLLQVAQEILPWWWPYPLIIGGVLFISALLLLVPVLWWRILQQTIEGAPRWFRETYLWKFSGPRCTIDVPQVDFQLIESEQMRQYATKVFVTVVVPEQTRQYCPIRCDFSNMTFELKQKRGIVPLIASLERNPILATDGLVAAPGRVTFWMGLSWFPFNNPAMLFVEPSESYKWEIRDIRIYMDNLQKYQILSKKGYHKCQKK